MKISASNKIIFTIAQIVLIFTGIVFMVVSITGMVNNRGELKEATGTIKTITKTTEETEDGKTKTKYNAEIVYKVDGQNFTIKKEVKKDVKEGDEIAIYYSVDDPNVYYFDDSNQGKNTILFLVIGIASILISTGWFVTMRILEKRGE